MVRAAGAYIKYKIINDKKCKIVDHGVMMYDKDKNEQTWALIFKNS